MNGQVKNLKDMLVRLELFKSEIMKRINILEENKSMLRPVAVYPMAQFRTLKIKKYTVYQLSYDGLLPHHDNQDKHYLKVIRDYYYHATLGNFTSEFEYKRFRETVIIYAQYFREDVVRDVDNRNTKYIQDAIRRSGLIIDDNWHKVWNMNIGLRDKETNHVQVFVVERSNFNHFFSFLMENHDSLKRNKNFYITKDEFFKAYKNRDKTLETNQEITEIFNEING